MVPCIFRIPLKYDLMFLAHESKSEKKEKDEKIVKKKERKLKSINQESLEKKNQAYERTNK